METHLSTKRWQDQLILLLGLWLFISPWVLSSYPIGSPASTNAYIAGIIIAVLAAFDLYKTYLWAVIVNLLIGVWVAVSPWALKIADERAITTNSLIVGIAVIVLGLWELRSDPELHKQWAGTSSAS